MTISHLAVDRGRDGGEQDVVQASQAGGGVGIGAGRERHDSMPFEAMHELMRHHAIRAKEVGAVETTRHRVMLFALASRAVRT